MGWDSATRQNSASQSLSRMIQLTWQRRESVCLDFSGVKVLTSRFLVAAVGALYGTFPPHDLEARLTFAGLDPVDAELVREVQAKAKRFYAAPPELRARLAEADRQFIPNN